MTGFAAVEDAVAATGPGWFAVDLVPHTLEVTTQGERRPADPEQLELDVVAKYVERLVAPFTDRAGAPMRAGEHEASVDGRVRQ
jgi:riboflavin synthase alpha subunit